MDLKTLIDGLQASLSCSICIGSLKEPVSARCKHSFCDECIAGAIKYSRPCPICNKHSKSRSLKNSTRLRALVPLVQRLINQLRTVDLPPANEKILEDGLQIIEQQSKVSDGMQCGGDHAFLQKTDAQNFSTPNKSSRLWGRLLSASASSSSNEDQNSSLRGAILQNEPCQESVEAKVANWLESSIPVTMDEHLKDNPEPEEIALLNNELMTMPSAACQVNGIEMDDHKLEAENMVTNDECDENEVSLQDSIFPKATIMKTFSSTNKMICIHRPEVMQFSQDTTSCKSVDRTVAANGLGNDFRENEKHNAVACESKAEEHNSQELLDKGTSAAVNSEKGYMGEYIAGEMIRDKIAHEVSSSKSANLLQCKRVEIFDAVQVKKYGYADIHAEDSEQNIVLRHLEEAIAKVPQCKPFPTWGSACNAKNKQRHSVKRTNIVHKSQDLISALVENLKPRKVATKRHFTTAKSAKSSKLARFSNNSNGVSLVPTCSVSDDDQTMRRRSLRAPTQRSYSSETRRKSWKCDSFSCSQPGSVPKSMTNVFVKMIRLDNDSKALSAGCEKSPMVQVSPTPEKVEFGSDRVAIKGRSLNIDISKPLQWQQRNRPAEEDDDIICCSWNESEKVVNQISRSTCATQGGASGVNNIPVANIMGLVGDDQSLKSSSPDLTGIAKIIDTLGHVAVLDKSPLLPHFAGCIEVVSEAVNLCKQAVHVLNAEMVRQNVELQKNNVTLLAPNSPQKSAVDSSPVPSAVDDCVADLVKSNSSWADDLVSNSEKSHNVKAPPEQNQTILHSHKVGTGSDASDVAAIDARSEDMLESLLPNEERVQLVVDEGKSLVQRSHKACDDVVAAKVESWLNRLTDLDERQGKKHKKLIGTKWRSSPRGNSRESLLKYSSQNITKENSGFSNAEFKIANSFDLPENDHSEFPSNVPKDSQSCSISKKLDSLVSVTQKSSSQKNSVVLPASDLAPAQSKDDTEAGFSQEKNIAHVDSSSHNMFEESIIIDSQLAGIICAGSPQSNDTESKMHKPNLTTNEISRSSPRGETRKNSDKVFDENQPNALVSIQSSVNIKKLESHTNGQDRQHVKTASDAQLLVDSIDQNLSPHKERFTQNHQHCPSVTDGFGFVTSGLQESEIKLVKLFAKRYGGKFHDVFHLKNVTHVIMKATKKRSCDRTLKYLMGIASKKWVISVKWVLDSLHAGRRLQEESYEVLGDNCMNEFGFDRCSNIPRGPTRSRTSGIHYKLLEYFLCVCVPPFCLITIEQTSQLLQLCGATVASNFDEFKHCVEKEDHFRNRLVIVDAEVAADFPNYASVEKEFNAAVINIEWVYESISRFEAQPLSNFALATFTQDSSVPM